MRDVEDTQRNGKAIEAECLICVNIQRSTGIADLVGMVMILGWGLSARRLMRIRYCVILVSRCLFLWTRNLGQ